MKASPEFVSQLIEGITALHAAFKADDIASLSNMRLFFIVHDAVTPGFEHNRKITLPINEQFHVEAMKLNDSHIDAAIGRALRLMNGKV